MLYTFKTLFYVEGLMVLGLVLFKMALNPYAKKLISPKIWLVSLIIPCVALFCSNVYVLFLTLSIMAILGSRSRAGIAGSYVFMLPLTPMLLVETRAGSVYLFAFSTAAALGLGALIGYLTSAGYRARPLLRYDLAFTFVIALFILTEDRDLGASGILRLITTYSVLYVGPYLLISRGIRTVKDVENFATMLLCGATVMAVTALFQVTRHWIIFETYYPALHVHVPFGSASMAMRGGLLRTGGSMVDYSSGGVFLAVVVTVLPLLRRQFTALGFAVVSALLIGGLLATQSRGAWIATIVGTMVIAGLNGKWGRIVVACASLGAALAFVFARGGAIAQILGMSAEAAGTADYRRQLAKDGLAQVLAHPWTGQPPAQLAASLSSLVQGQHIVDFVNSHLYIALIGGIPALFVWSYAWLMPIVESVILRKVNRGFGVLPAAMIVPAFVALTFTSIIDRNLVWMFIGLAVAPACFRRSARGGRAELA